MGWLGRSGCRTKPRLPGGRVGLGPGRGQGAAGAGGAGPVWFTEGSGERQIHVGTELGLPGPVRAGSAPHRQHRTRQAGSPRVGLGEMGRVWGTESVCVCLCARVSLCVQLSRMCVQMSACVHARASCAWWEPSWSLLWCETSQSPAAEQLPAAVPAWQGQDRSHRVCAHTCRWLRRAQVCLSSHACSARRGRGLRGHGACVLAPYHRALWYGGELVCLRGRAYVAV